LALPDRTLHVTLTSLSGSYLASITFVAPTMEVQTVATIVLTVNPDQSRVELDYTNNELTTTITFLDIRPDLSIVTDDISVRSGNTPVTGETFGKTVTIRATVRNLGGSSVDSLDLEMGISNTAGYNDSFYKVEDLEVSAEYGNNSLNVTYQWRILLTDAGAYSLWVRLDVNNTISEPNEGNNFATRPFEIIALQVQVDVSTDFQEYDAGDMVLISATIKYYGSTIPVAGLENVVFWLVDTAVSPAQVVPGSNSTAQTTGDDGTIIVYIRVPADIDSGTYNIRAVILDQTYDSELSITVSAAAAEGLFPWWVWVLIIVAVVGVVAGFTIYTYVYGLGKLVECGECGAFIPAASKRCPKCGVEFESGTMKCSECGSWIPAESTECPNCGVQFVGESEAEADYMDRMRKEYDENVVSKYRELARPELGKKFSDKAFEEWWKSQPGYISFEDWLAKEEEKKKEGPVACPVCGTLNPKEATVCHKCGTVFAAVRAGSQERRGPPPGGAAAEQEEARAEPAQQAQAPQAAPAAAPRMVIRRPIDRKVVPKKIIKTPVEGEEKSEGGDENQ